MTKLEEITWNLYRYRMELAEDYNKLNSLFDETVVELKQLNISLDAMETLPDCEKLLDQLMMVLAEEDAAASERVGKKIIADLRSRAES